jgi:predicted Zn-ribbon and HTH transcriptional regulator
VVSDARCHQGAGRRPRFELADIVRAHREELDQSHPPTPEQARVLRDIMRCRTAALGGHVDQCVECGFERPAYNSCRNRHCPKCQALAQHRWLERRLERILPTPSVAALK